MARPIIHIINSTKEKAFLFFADGSHEIKRYPFENFSKNENLYLIFYNDIKELQEKGFLILFE